MELDLLAGAGAAAAGAAQAAGPGEGAHAARRSEELLDLHEHAHRQRARRRGPSRVRLRGRPRPAGRVCLKKRVFRWRIASSLLIVASSLASAVGAAGSVLAQTAGIREVTAIGSQRRSRCNTRLRYTTMIVLPDGEEILDVICGDRDFWVISAVQNVAHVKPAKAGAETNLNLVTARGTIYSFLLSEKSGRDAAGPEGLRERRPDRAGRPTEVLQRRRGRAAAGRADRGAGGDRRGRAARTRRRSRSERQQFPTQLQFAYGAPKYERPFLVRAIWHDGQFTYLKTDATELPALYELKDGKPALVNFQVQRRHLRRAEGARARLPRARQRALRVRAAGAVVMADHVDTPGTAPVVDRRPVPRGVLPRGVQTWLMVALAVGMLLHHLPDRASPRRRPRARQAAGAPQAPSADRVRDYQERLRVLDEQAAQRGP